MLGYVAECCCRQNFNNNANLLNTSECPLGTTSGPQEEWICKRSWKYPESILCRPRSCWKVAPLLLVLSHNRHNTEVILSSSVLREKFLRPRSKFQAEVQHIKVVTTLFHFKTSTIKDINIRSGYCYDEEGYCVGRLQLAVVAGW